VIAALAEGKAKFVPDILVTGGGGNHGGGALDGLAATAMRFLAADRPSRKAGDTAEAKVENRPEGATKGFPAAPGAPEVS
jgi:hypothetical protein